jgi:vacuolar-type H+-ATPase subunit I/STV1
MPVYHCKCCDYETHIKTHYTKHMKTKKHLNCIQNVSKNDNGSKDKGYHCKYCNKSYKYSQGLSKHIKYTCKKNKDEDLKELARLLNETNEEMSQLIKHKDNELSKMQRQIDKLTQKLQIKNMASGNIINNNTIYNIQLLNYNFTDYSHLTEGDYIECINDCNRCVMSLIKRVHFNSNKPENMNIYISSIKGNYVMVYKDNAWQIQDKKEQIDDLYDYNEVVLVNWYDEYKQKYPDIIKSFQRYLKNKDDSDVINEVKHEILKMLYNKRNMIQEEVK